MMEDESGVDEKIIAVPIDKLDISFSSIKDINDVNSIIILRIKHFFEHYKDLEQGKWVKILVWQGIKTAKRLIEEGAKRSIT